MVDSTDLKQTSLNATLNCPIPEHKNVIWCSTFQMAWDKLKNDMIGEPIEVPEAKELASRLNQTQFDPKGLDAKSFYATVGIVKEGIVEQIQKEVTRRFPSAITPVFDELDELSQGDKEASIVAYAYLNVDIDFEHHFYTNDQAFEFQDSTGTRTNITSFRARTDPGSSNSVREQVDILYYKYDDQASDVDFAVDLCKHTNPYQVVLARMLWPTTLGQAVAAVEKQISEFKLDTDHEALRKLRPIDRLIVPDVLYKLTHHFTELEGKALGNPGWQLYGFFEAMQMIDFALSRTGIVLKSEARLIAAPFSISPRQMEKPRFFHFNKPFLIYVKKRGTDYSPFFVMWVDNTELMERF
jgi:hypothetical protein